MCCTIGTLLIVEYGTSIFSMTVWYHWMSAGTAEDVQETER